MLPGDKRFSVTSLAEWQFVKFLQQSNSFSLSDLEMCLKHILACELSVKGLGKGDGSPRLHLETLIFKLSRRGER